MKHFRVLTVTVIGILSLMGIGFIIVWLSDRAISESAQGDHEPLIRVVNGSRPGLVGTVSRAEPASLARGDASNAGDLGEQRRPMTVTEMQAEHDAAAKVSDGGY